MKRFHVHVHVADLEQSIRFYSRLFAAEPARHESDYAKWMLEDPPVNFAISRRGGAVGVDHLGFQASNEAELAELRTRAAAAEQPVFDEGATSCCYARSDKHWITDPQGLAWEQFHTLADIPVFSETRARACCPSDAAPRGKPLPVAVKSECC
jgi:catechol 2,3-dioxygenase-like lactoylglutathione lyase family enzyme